MHRQAIRFTDKLAKIDRYWSPRVIAELHSQSVAGAPATTHQFKLVKIQGEFVWHQHDDTDEVFLVLDGEMRLRFEDGVLPLRCGELYVVPRGTPHRPEADQVCSVLLIEPRGVVNTGEAGGTLTAPNDVWI